MYIFFIHNGHAGTVFSLFDKDNSGTVSFDELSSILSALGGGREVMPEREMKQLIKAIKNDHKTRASVNSPKSAQHPAQGMISSSIHESERNQIIRICQKKL